MLFDDNSEGYIKLYVNFSSVGEVAEIILIYCGL